MQVREVEVRYKPSKIRHDGRRALMCAKDVARLLTPVVEGVIQEKFFALHLNARHRPLGWTTIAIGSVSACPVNMADAFRTAVLLGAKAIIFAHNHPSGEKWPSTADRLLTERLQDAGKLLGIDVLDHVILTDNETRFFSFADDGAFAQL